MSVYDQVKQALQDIVAPQLAELRGELRGDIANVHKEIAELRGEFRQEIAELRGELREEIVEVRGKVETVQAEIRRLDERLAALNEKVDMTAEIRERLAALEARAR
ncbi:MAG: hypothetical protein HY735_36230 [Verrucomicrobia bacterium]|nr:hypothetical protein [Verrucomicrobiota bacterium]